MIVIEEIYNEFGIRDLLPPHYFELENVATLFIPETQNKNTTMIHLIPHEQNFSPSRLTALIQASQVQRAPNQTATLLLSRSVKNVIRFHILSANAEDETQAVSQLLSFFIEEMNI